MKKIRFTNNKKNFYSLIRFFNYIVIIINILIKLFLRLIQRIHYLLYKIKKKKKTIDMTKHSIFILTHMKTNIFFILLIYLILHKNISKIFFIYFKLAGINIYI
jgi:hypothetical protein